MTSPAPAILDVSPQDLFDRAVAKPLAADLGPLVVRDDIRSTAGPFRTLPNYRVQYPRVVVEALIDLYREYNHAFGLIVPSNQEWQTDYQFCRDHDDVGYTNFAVQIDMVGLPQEFLDAAASMPLPEVVRVLRGRIFEIENSLAMYQLLQKTHPFFKQRFRGVMDALRDLLDDRPIALLAVTDQKHQAIRESEFGKMGDEPLSDAEVRELSGFDKLFGPAEFAQHVRENGGRSKYLLYARTSDPVAKLKDPSITVEHPILSNPELRRVVRAHCLTINVDNPSETDPARRVNDTKAYLGFMGMGVGVPDEVAILPTLFSPALMAHLFSGGAYDNFKGASRLSEKLRHYLVSHGVDPTQVESGVRRLRAKPAQGTYGCYGHLSGGLNGAGFRNQLHRGVLRYSGGYVVQPEMAKQIITNTADGVEYDCIDRNFFAVVDGRYCFLGGHRSLMPKQTKEAEKGRNHGNHDTVWAEISGD